MDLKQQNKLLYARAGFGISVEHFHNPQPIDTAVAQLFPQSEPAEIIVITENERLLNTPGVMKAAAKEMTEGEQKQMKKAFRGKVDDLNLAWMDTMAKTKNPLLEKAALFWHGHFATRIENPYADQKLLHILRKNALGNFGTMLKEVSKSAAMIQFLNNQQNRKQHPNENFAREVMELFTLGRGHYTEDDIKEAARAFTGWGYDGNGSFAVRLKQHDDGEKKFLGKKGNFNGDDILDILLDQKQTAILVTQKIYSYFVSDEKIDDKRVKDLAAHFYKSKYDIGGLLKEIFTADWFYKDGTVGNKVKSPVELLVGHQRLMPLNFAKPNTLINIQRVLGQRLFYPPNVAGWPGGRNWIDSSSLVIRMRLPDAILGSKELNLTPKETEAEMPDKQHVAVATSNEMSRTPQNFRVGRASVDWTSYLAFWKNTDRQQLPAALADYLLTIPLPAERLKEIDSFADKDNDDDYIKSLTILLMGLPEYQLT